MAFDMGQFNRNIRAEMVRRGVTQTDLADILGLNQAALSRRLNGRIDWTLSEAGRVADALHVSLTDLAPEAAA